MTRLIQDTNSDGTCARTLEVVDLNVRAPHGEHFKFVRGKQHTPYDIAAFIIKAAKLVVSTESVYVTDHSGALLFPTMGYTQTVEARRKVHAKFLNARELNVYLRLPGVTP